MLVNTQIFTLFFPIIAVGLALLTAFILHKIYPLSLPSFRYTSIDGLRGYLAFFVFLHHAYVWHRYIHTGVWGSWDLVNAPLYRYFGSASVMIFFMITAFLFFGRLLDSRKNLGSIDWLNLYTSRVMRIAPLFLFASCVAFVVAGYTYKWELNCDLAEITRQAILTLGIGLFGAPIVEIFHQQGIGGPIMAGALWTLPYEWMFYFLLPVFALTLKIKCPKYILIIPTLALCYLLLHPLPRVPANAFISGILVAYLVRTKFQKYLRTKASAGLTILFIVIAILNFEDPFGFYPLLILTFFFGVIASGNSFFGILHWKISRVLGEISFGIYLLHGILLFLLTRIILQDSKSITLNEIEYWISILMCTPALIIFSYFTFTKIEKPCMNLSPALAKKIRNLLARLKAGN